MATSGEHLYLWNVPIEGHITLKEELKNPLKTSCESSEELSSLDWSISDPRLIATSSLSTNCTIWDIIKCEAKTTLIAHEKEVYDIAFSLDPNNFATGSADGSIRLFDTRALEQSLVLFESESAILRVMFNTLDMNYISAIAIDSYMPIILDRRNPVAPLCEFAGHYDCINSCTWSPQAP